MKSIFSLTAALALMWWLWSGYAVPLLLGFGLLSCVLVAWLSHRMGLTDHESIPLLRMPRIMLYWLWLIGEILKSNVVIGQRIITGRIQPATQKLPATQQTNQGRVTYANSITLTPGTLSYELESDRVHVHALHASSLNSLDEGGMASKVNKLVDRR